MKRRICLIGILFLSFISFAIAQAKDDNSSQSVTLVVSGTGNTEDEALKNALRKAIEQTYGTFVSSNTTIVNDELTKDEIVSVSAGNIESYKEIDCNKDNNVTTVTVKATISIGKLVQFAKSKGATTELAGAAFAMNMKMRKLNKENELQALKDMFEKMLKICDTNLFDYSLKTDEFERLDDTIFVSKTHITITPNNNYTNLVNEYERTLSSLGLSDEETEAYEKTHMNTFVVPCPNGINDFWRVIWVREYEISNEKYKFNLRNDLWQIKDKKGNRYIDKLRSQLLSSMFRFKLFDNLGNCAIPYCWRTAVQGTARGVGGWYKIDERGLPIYTRGSDYDYDNEIICVNIYGLKNTNNRNRNSFLYYKDRISTLSGGYIHEFHLACDKTPICFVPLPGFGHLNSDCGLNHYLLKKFPSAITLFIGYDENDISKLEYVKVEPVDRWEVKDVPSQEGPSHYTGDGRF